MKNIYDVLITVVSQKGICDRGNKVGDQWIVKNDKLPKGMCVGAFSAMYPFMRVLMEGGSFSWRTDPDVVHVACIDPDTPVYYELRRLKKPDEDSNK